MRRTTAQESEKIMKKRRILSFICILTIFISTQTVFAASKTVDMNLWGVGSGITVREASRLANKIGKMKKKTSKMFPSFYMIGNKVTIGVNENARPMTSASEYIRVINNGNKKLTICGNKIGASKSSVVKKMEQAGFRSFKSGKQFIRGQAGVVTITYKNGKMQKWKYVLKPTS